MQRLYKSDKQRLISFRTCKCHCLRLFEVLGAPHWPITLHKQEKLNFRGAAESYQTFATGDGLHRKQHRTTRTDDASQRQNTTTPGAYLTILFVYTNKTTRPPSNETLHPVYRVTRLKTTQHIHNVVRVNRDCMSPQPEVREKQTVSERLTNSAAVGPPGSPSRSPRHCPHQRPANFEKRRRHPLHCQLGRLQPALAAVRSPGPPHPRPLLCHAF